MQPPIDVSSWELTIGYENRVSTISLAANQALASSGVAFQGSHVIDPSTRSATYNWNRSYAIAPRAALADAASTAALLLDPKSLDIISQQDPDLSFALFSNDSEFHCGLHFECLSES
jgi:thiamine biosynthesis lipoprotein